MQCLVNLEQVFSKDMIHVQIYTHIFADSINEAHCALFDVIKIYTYLI